MAGLFIDRHLNVRSVDYRMNLCMMQIRHCAACSTHLLLRADALAALELLELDGLDGALLRVGGHLRLQHRAHHARRDVRELDVVQSCSSPSRHDEASVSH